MQIFTHGEKECCAISGPWKADAAWVLSFEKITELHDLKKSHCDRFDRFCSLMEARSYVLAESIEIGPHAKCPKSERVGHCEPSRFNHRICLNERHARHYRRLAAPLTV